MSKEKLLKIIEAAVIIALGILIAIFGGGAVLDIYLGVVAAVLGVAFLALSIASLVNTKELPLATLCLATICITFAVALFAQWLSFTLFIYVLVYLIIGFGAALVLHGIYLLCKKLFVMGLAEVIIGAGAITIAVLFLTVPEFQKAFWIILGVLIALYGAFYLVSALLEKKKN